MFSHNFWNSKSFLKNHVKNQERPQNVFQIVLFSNYCLKFPHIFQTFQNIF